MVTHMNTKQVAERLGIHPQTLKNWRVTGKGPAYLHVGKAIRYREQDVDLWEKANRSVSTT